MIQEEKDRLFAQLLSEYRELFADMDELNRTLWFAANEENELMSFIVESGESTDEAMERYKAKLLAIASALESLPCASTEQRTIAELRGDEIADEGLEVDALGVVAGQFGVEARSVRYVGDQTVEAAHVVLDHVHQPLARLGRKDILLVSAGDGSSKALGRIHSGLSQQIATVAEPLGAHGWQLVDELNRAFAGQPPSGFVGQPLLITAQVLRESENISIELDTSHEEAYLRLWRPRVGR